LPRVRGAALAGGRGRRPEPPGRAGGRRDDRNDGAEAGAEANVAKYLAAEAAFEAADAAVQTHGGFGVAREYDVERYFREAEARLTRLVPVTQQLASNYLGERVLGLPQSC
jgi:acyl-CoA dehydrogenase